MPFAGRRGLIALMLVCVLSVFVLSLNRLEDSVSAAVSGLDSLVEQVSDVWDDYMVGPSSDQDRDLDRDPGQNSSVNEGRSPPATTGSKAGQKTTTHVVTFLPKKQVTQSQ